MSAGNSYARKWGFSLDYIAHKYNAQKPILVYSGGGVPWFAVKKAIVLKDHWKGGMKGVDISKRSWRFQKNLIARAKAYQPRYIFLSGLSAHLTLNGVTPWQHPTKWAQIAAKGALKTIQSLQRVLPSADIVVILPHKHPEHHMTKCIASHPKNASKCDGPAVYVSGQLELCKELKKVVKATSAIAFDPTTFFCPKNYCKAKLASGDPTFIDFHHPSDSFFRQSGAKLEWWLARSGFFFPLGNLKNHKFNG